MRGHMGEDGVDLRLESQALLDLLVRDVKVGFRILLPRRWSERLLRLLCGISRHPETEKNS